MNLCSYYIFHIYWFYICLYLFLRPEYPDEILFHQRQASHRALSVLSIENNAVINLTACLLLPDAGHYAGVTEHQPRHRGQSVPLAPGSPAHGAHVTRNIGGQQWRRRRNGLARECRRLCVLSIVPPIF